MADEHDQDDVADELPVAEHPGEAEGGDERVEGQADRRRGVEERRAGRAARRPRRSSARPPRPAPGHAGAWPAATLPPAPASAAQASRKAASERASTASRAWRAGSCMVYTPIGVSVGSATRSSAASGDAAGDVADGDHEPETLARVALDGHGRLGADGDARQQVEGLGGDVGSADVGAVGGDEAGRQPGPVGAVDDAGGDRDGPLEGLARRRRRAACAGRAGRGSGAAPRRCAGGPSASPSGPTPASGSCAARRRRRSRAGCGSRPGRAAGPAPAGAGRARPGRASACRGGGPAATRAPRRRRRPRLTERASPSTSWRTAVSGPIVSTPRRSVGMR